MTVRGLSSDRRLQMRRENMFRFMQPETVILHEDDVRVEVNFKTAWEIEQDRLRESSSKTS